MAELSFIVGIIGNVISILVFTSPIGTFNRIVKNKSTESFKWQPYVTTLLSTSLWTFYGLLKPGGLLVVTVNGVGCVLQLTCVSLFLIYAPKSTKIKMARLVAILNVGFYGLVILVVLLAIHGTTRLLLVGVLCAALTVGMYASPLAAMRTVVKTKSVEYMPFSLSFFLFLNAGIWSMYAVLVKDYFIGVPNVIGFILGSAQLILYTMYKMKTPSSSKSTEMDEEEGSAHLVYDKEIGMVSKERHLNKGNSLPRPSLAHENSFKKIAKSLSLNTCYDLQYHLHQYNPLEK